MEPIPSEQQIKNQTQLPLLVWLLAVLTHLISDVCLVRHVNTQFRGRDKVFPRALRDHHASFLMEHRSDLWWRLRGR